MEEYLKKELKIKESAAKKNSDKKTPSSPLKKAKRELKASARSSKKNPKAEINFFTKSLAKEKWGQIQNDMSKAINYWDDIAKKYEGKPNHDEKQMQEIKRLLQDLQKKLNHFS